MPTLRALREAGHEILTSSPNPTAPPGADGNSRQPRSPNLRLIINCPSSGPQTSILKHFAPADVMVVIAFGQKIADSVVNHPRLGSVNLHASRLPKYRGAAPINAAILAGETVAGNSIIRLAQEDGRWRGARSIVARNRRIGNRRRIARSARRRRCAVDACQSWKISPREPQPKRFRMNPSPPSRPRCRATPQRSTGRNPQNKSPGKFAVFLPGRAVACASSTSSRMKSAGSR